MEDSVTISGRFVERRSGKDRRCQPDKRKAIRFDDNGGDRRQGEGRRSDDLCLRLDD